MVVSRNITGVIAWMAGILVALVAAALPAVYFAIGWQSNSAALKTEADIYAGQLSAVINYNPDMWMYEVVRLEGLLSPRAGVQYAESRRILDLDGKLVAQQAEDLPWPVLVRSHRLLDSGVPVGTLEISRSLRPLAVRTAFLGLIGLVLGTTLFYLLRVYPMSALRNALELLSREKEWAQVTLRSIGDGVISTDSEGRVDVVNRVAESLTGWLQGEAAGRPFDEVFRQEGSDLVARDGSRRLVEVSRSPILDETGRSLGDVYVFRDVTEKARAAEEMLKVQKLESLGILAGGVAHEIRNPLSAVNISISSIEHVCRDSHGLETDGKEKVRLIIEQMKSAAAKMGVVVQRVMDFSKPTPSRMATVNLNDAVEEAIRLSLSTLRTRGIALVRDLSPDLPACRADLRLVEQVLVNLITNAYQAMEKAQGTRTLEIATGIEDGRIVIRVADSGPGVPPAIRERIFDPFFTTRKDGSGIGLSFSQRIVAEHGGTLDVGSSRWGGAEFRIAIPRTPKGPGA